MNIFHWGPFPNERDGGASVNYWTWTKYHQLFPEDRHFAIPKHPPELVRKLMPFITYLSNKPEKFLKIIDKYEPKVVESFHIMSQKWTNIVELLVNKNVPFILHQTIHWQDDICLKILSEANTMPNVIVCPTRWAENFLSNFSETVYIPHGVDTELFKPTEKKRKETVILFNGRFDMWKGVQLLIPLIRPILNQFKNVRFVIRACSFKGLNRSEVLHEIYHRLAKIHEGKLILYDKWLPYNRMPSLMRNADILVFPSGHEGFGVPLIEAMACGKPVIATDLPNMREIVGQRAGFLLKPTVPVGNVNESSVVRVPTSQQLSEALFYLLENPEIGKEMGEIGRERVLKYYDMRKVVEKWHELFHRWS